MSKFELKLPQMGESVAEGTLTSWLKDIGETIEMDEAVFEIATDKVDSEVPSEVEGVLVEKCFKVDEVVKVGQTVAIIEVNGEKSDPIDSEKTDRSEEPSMEMQRTVSTLEADMTKAKEAVAAPSADYGSSSKFYSPLVRNIAGKEGISVAQLDTISGTGQDGRVTKTDILAYLDRRKSVSGPSPAEQTKVGETLPSTPVEPIRSPQETEEVKIQPNAGDEVIPLTRMGKLIAQHMTDSLATSAHVQSFVEVDVTNVVNWRNKIKVDFEKREGEKLTFTPIFMEAVAKALKKFPLVNISLDGDRVIKKKNINIGMATALPDGNLIVPVIKNADQLNLVGMAKAVNDLALRARTNALKPEEVKDGTYTVTNVGSFGSIFGTPIINQPQVGILALGAIRKIPAVIETEEGDLIGIRSKMFLSHSYDHRVVNGALGGLFAKAVADYLEGWDMDREF
jgi:2-oxoglutarate dehydrogenase E2 component (dihydrolipoamide succinyltransferase)